MYEYIQKYNRKLKTHRKTQENMITNSRNSCDLSHHYK